MRVTGLPRVNPPRTPEVICTWSVSIFMRPPRPWPCWRRARSALRSEALSGTPAGSPSAIATRHCPCDSPAVRYLSIAAAPRRLDLFGDGRGQEEDQLDLGVPDGLVPEEGPAEEPRQIAQDRDLLDARRGEIAEDAADHARLGVP